MAIGTTGACAVVIKTVKNVVTGFIRLNAALEYTPHLIRRMRRLLQGNRKNLGTTWNLYHQDTGLDRVRRVWREKQRLSNQWFLAKRESWTSCLCLL